MILTVAQEEVVGKMKKGQTLREQGGAYTLSLSRESVNPVVARALIDKKAILPLEPSFALKNGETCYYVSADLYEDDLVLLSPAATKRSMGISRFSRRRDNQIIAGVPRWKKNGIIFWYTPEQIKYIKEMYKKNPHPIKKVKQLNKYVVRDGDKFRPLGIFDKDGNPKTYLKRHWPELMLEKRKLIAEPGELVDCHIEGKMVRRVLHEPQWEGQIYVAIVQPNSEPKIVRLFEEKPVDFSDTKSAIVTMVRNGSTYQAVADAIGVSRAYVGQVVAAQKAKK